MRRAIAFVCCLAFTCESALAREITWDTLAAFERWTGAVQEHAPGQTDASLAVATGLTFDERVALDEGMPFFLSALRGRTPAADSEPKKRLFKLARQVGVDNPNLFLKRAAVLHSDAAIIRSARSRDAGELDLVERGGTGSPIFPKGFLILDDDGEAKGRAPRDWNWVFARSLLDLLSPRSDHRPFLAAWYHATTAMMFRDGVYGEATYHLEHALQVLPDEPRLLFDVACLSEVDGLPIFQQTLSDQELEKLRRQFAPSTGRANTVGRSFVTIAALSGIPPVEIANGDAERLFRRALQLDPSLTEAHARLARLLTIRGKHADALEQAEAALAAKPDPVVSFYAHMFAGRAARALGRLELAAGHYAQARTLFPDAQSAAIGASEVALLRADVGGATAAVRPLGELATADPDVEKDPWWGYRFGPGHDSDELLAAMWSAITAKK